MKFLCTWYLVINCGFLVFLVFSGSAPTHFSSSRDVDLFYTTKNNSNTNNNNHNYTTNNTSSSSSSSNRTIKKSSNDIVLRSAAINDKAQQRLHVNKE